MSTKLGLVAALFICSFSNSSLANPASGSDMWTGAMNIANLFTPHPNNCDSSEAFVEIVLGFGYCIEINERPPASWVNARNTCIQNFKRLPELAEWQFACLNYSSLGLMDMDAGFEWISNFFNLGDAGNPPSQLNVPIANGSGAVGTFNCSGGRGARIANSSGNSQETHGFRCVR